MKLLYTALFALLFPAFLFSQNTEAYFLSQPCLTPNGQTVVFSFEGDLWKADIANPLAVRLTAMQGYETNARVSPDGKWIAFTGRQYGNGDIFIMPVAGGDVKQLTFHSTNDIVSSWSWDSKSIYFTSAMHGQQSGYKVNISGGTPERVLGDYFFQYDHNLVEHPLTGEIYFNDTWESSNQLQRKHYKGAFNPDIQSYNIKTKQYKRYTDYEGKDFGATLDKNGNLYFISDEGNNEYNLYTIDNGKKRQLTQYTTSIKNAAASANGGKIVFEKDYQLYVYDVASKKAEKLAVTVFRNSILSKEKDFEVRGNITSADISPDGKKLAFTSRGELFVSDVDGKFVTQIMRGNAERALEVKWLADNKTLLFNTTVDGYYNWCSVAADGSAAMKQITSDKKNNRSLSLNKNKTKAVYLSGRDEVKLMDLKTLQSKTIVKDEIWGFQGSDPGFSPNDEYVCFGAFRNFEQDIFLYNIATTKIINLTNTGISEFNPVWQPDGKYIYFTSSRLKPYYPMGLQNPKVYRLPLEKFDEPFKSDKYKELFKTEVKDTTKAKKDSVNKIATTAITIDADNIMERIEMVSPAFGSQQLATVLQKGDKITVLYTSDHEAGKGSLWKTVIEPFEANKTEKIAGAEARGFDVVTNGDKHLAIFNGAIYKLNLDGNKVDGIAISYTFRRNLSEEFKQVFYEAWAQLETNYYDENFHGVNWLKVREQYSKFLPKLNTRADLRVLLNDMLGELNSSHQGFTTNGEDENIQLANRTMETGILFQKSDPYKVNYVVNRSTADRKNITIKKDDELIKVNGTAVDKTVDRNYYFTHPSLDKEMVLTFKRGTEEFDIKLHPQATLYNNLYDEWIDDNRKRVNEKSNNKIAYSHMKNMGTEELENFIIDMTKQLNNKEALILDLRYNTGGNVHDEVLKFLSQRSYLQWKYREGKLTRQGNFTPSDKPIVLLINEQSLSDAEMTAQGFKALKLGSIIGNETYRWIIFTSGTGLVDGSFVRLPSWGCYTLDGKDLELTGVQPDIKVVNSFEDKISGKDPQLDKAIEEILKKIK